MCIALMTLRMSSSPEIKNQWGRLNQWGQTRLILCGGDTADGHWSLFEATVRNILAAVLAYDEDVTIARATLGNDPGIVGTASLVL